MIAYELAKELKDTGYVGSDLESGKPNAPPDLEEFIESCGTEFGRLRVFSLDYNESRQVRICPRAKALGDEGCA